MQLVEALRYKPEGRGFDSRWCHWNFPLTNPSSRTMALGSTQLLTEMSTRNISYGLRQPVRKANNLTAFMCRLSWYLGASAYWRTQGLSRPVMGLLYLYLLHHYKIRNYQCVRDSVVAMKATRIGGEEVQLHPFLTSSVDGGERSASRPSRCTTGKPPPPPQYSFSRRLGGPQSRSGSFGKERTSYLYQKSNPGPSGPWPTAPWVNP